MRVIALLALCAAAVAAVPTSSKRIPSGFVTVDQYPTMAAVLYASDMVFFWQSCGGTILNNRSILSAAHCTWRESTHRLRLRVGSSWADSGGDVHIVQSIIQHPDFSQWKMDMDVVILRSAATICYNSNVRPASIAGPNYSLADNQALMAVGWAETSEEGPLSMKLHHAQIYKFSQEYCRSSHSTFTDNLICAGVQNATLSCQQTSGDPLFHKGVLVGITTYSDGCQQQLPATYVFVPKASNWIVQNA